MIARIFRAVWFLSLLAATATLLYQYASLPPSVVILSDNGEDLSVSNDTLFYLMTALLCVVNVLVFPFSYYQKNDAFRSWFFGLIITVNIFLIIGFSFISLFNSGEKYDFARLQPVIIGSIVLVISWSVAWPLYWVFRNLRKKSPAV